MTGLHLARNLPGAGVASGVEGSRRALARLGPCAVAFALMVGASAAPGAPEGGWAPAGVAAPSVRVVRSRDGRGIEVTALAERAQIRVPDRDGVFVIDGLAPDDTRPGAVRVTLGLGCRDETRRAWVCIDLPWPAAGPLERGWIAMHVRNLRSAVAGRPGALAVRATLGAAPAFDASLERRRIGWTAARRAYSANLPPERLARAFGAAAQAGGPIEVRLAGAGVDVAASVRIGAGAAWLDTVLGACGLASP